MNIDKQNVADLLEAIKLTPEATIRVLRILRENLPLVRRADTEKGEFACVLQACRDVLAKDKWAREDLDHFMLVIMNSITELCNYPPKARGQLIDAAIAESEHTVKWLRSLKQVRSGVKAAIERISLRDRALLSVLMELWDTDATQGTEFLNAIEDAVQDTSVDILRSDPSLGDLLRIFDEAKANPTV